MSKFLIIIIMIILMACGDSEIVVIEREVPIPYPQEETKSTETVVVEEVEQVHVETNVEIKEEDNVDVTPPPVIVVQQPTPPVVIQQETKIVEPKIEPPKIIEPTPFIIELDDFIRVNSQTLDRKLGNPIRVEDQKNIQNRYYQKNQTLINFSLIEDTVLGATIFYAKGYKTALEAVEALGFTWQEIIVGNKHGNTQRFRAFTRKNTYKFLEAQKDQSGNWSVVVVEVEGKDIFQKNL